MAWIRAALAAGAGLPAAGRAGPWAWVVNGHPIAAMKIQTIIKLVFRNTGSLPYACFSTPC
jgi:hypothetical protein